MYSEHPNMMVALDSVITEHVNGDIDGGITGAMPRYNSIIESVNTLTYDEVIHLRFYCQNPREFGFWPRRSGGLGPPRVTYNITDLSQYIEAFGQPSNSYLGIIETALPQRIMNEHDAELWLHGLTVLSPDNYNRIQRMTNMSMNDILKIPIARKFPMRPFITDEGVKLEVNDDWRYFFFSGGASQENVNFKFLLLPILNNEELFLKEAIKRYSAEMIQAYNIRDYDLRMGSYNSRTGNIERRNVKMSAYINNVVVRDDISDVCSVIVAKTAYVKLFISDSFMGRRFICNMYFELLNTPEAETIHIKYLHMPGYQFFTSGRLMEREEVLDVLNPTVKSKPFIKQAFDPQFKAYLNAVMTVTKPKLVLKTRGRKLGLIGGAT